MAAKKKKTNNSKIQYIIYDHEEGTLHEFIDAEGVRSLIISLVEEYVVDPKNNNSAVREILDTLTVYQIKSSITPTYHKKVDITVTF